MGRSKRFKNGPKLWERKSGRLCRCDQVDQREYPLEKITSSLSDSESSHPDCCKNFSVLDLPDECLIIVLKNLQFFEICNVARVCKRFYQLSCIPTLWDSVDLSSVNRFRLSSFVDLDCPSKMMTFPKRRLLLAKFLCARGAALTDIHGEANICREADMFRFLLNCNVTNLQTVRLRLPFYTHRAQDMQDLDVLNYLVQRCCNSLKYLKCYVDISSSTVKLLGGLQSLERLNLRFLPAYLALQPDALDAMLSSLPNLKYLKISIFQSIKHYTEGPHFIPGYIVKSDSLEVLDFGYSKQFFIINMILPKLHTLHTECLWFFYGDGMPEICLYDVIERGCPQLQTFNEFTSPLPGLQNFNLSDKQKSYFCTCSAHRPVRALH